MMYPQNVPDALKSLDHWVVWKTTTRDGKPTKPPYDANKNGQHAYAETNNPATWAFFARACEMTDIFNGSDYEGEGFVFTDTDYVGVDLDGVVHEDDTIDPFAVEILKLANSYCEFSPSGTGAHVIFESSLPLPKGNRKGSKQLGGEIYNKTSPRYFTVTGNKIAGFSTDGIAKIDDPRKLSLLHFMVMHLHDTKITKLWMGDLSAYDNDQSRADLALLGILAQLFDNDAQKMEWAFSASVLGRRDKWTERKDYRDRTIMKAISGKSPNNPDSSGPAPESLSEIAQLVFTLPPVATTDANYLEYVLAGVMDSEKPMDDQSNEPWFPRGAVSLIGAPSGAGKTTLMYQALLTQRCKGVFLGHASFGFPFVVLGADRGKGANYRTMRRMRIPPETLPFIGLATSFDRRAVQQVINTLEALPVMPTVVLIEGVDMMVTKVSDIQCVTIFMDLLHAVAERFHIAIIGTLGSPKIKVGQGYAAKRDNMLGSSGWGRKCETYLNLQFPKSDDMDSRRLLFMLPRNGKSEKLTLEFNHGQLERIPDIIEDELDSPSTELDWYQTQARLAVSDPTKRWFTVSDMKKALHLSHATAARHIGDALAKGFIKTKPGPKVGKGAAEQYQWNETETNPLWIAQQAQDAEERQEAFS